jgi:LysR family hydrogen peroxide-inducible transcriptional activator
MNLRDLDYVLAVAETGHFGAAAERCHVSQPTLSTQVRKLEAELGAALFERGSRGAVPTEAGRAVIAQARAVVDAAARLRELAAGRRDPLAGVVRLGIIPTSGPYLLPHLLPVLQRRFPALRLYLKEAMTAHLLAQLLRADLDAAILSPPFDTAGLELHPLGEEAFLVALPPSHPLAAAPAIDSAAIAGETFLTLEEGHCLRDQTAAICRRLGLVPHHEVQASSIESLRQMVSLGVGCALVPAFAGKGPFAAGAPIALRPLADAPGSRELVLAWRRSHPHGPALRTLARAIGETIAAL